MTDKLSPRKLVIQANEAAELEKERAYADALVESMRQFEATHRASRVSQVVTEEEKERRKAESRALAQKMLEEVESWDQDEELKEIVAKRDAEMRKTVMERAAERAQPKSVEEVRTELTRKIWLNLIGRCTDTSNRAYRYWGAQGVKVHPAWVDSFAAFVADVGLCPSPLYELRRLDVTTSVNFEPGNVGWKERTSTRNTAEENGRAGAHPGGRPRKGEQVLLEYDGKMMTMPELAKYTGVKESTIRARHAAGKSIDQIVLPVRANARGMAWNVTYGGGEENPAATPVVVTLKEMCQAKGLPYATVKARLKRGIPLGMALYPKKEKQTVEERRYKMREYYHKVTKAKK